MELMVEKDYEAITVQEIIDRADVGRSTFYTHYVGKEDLLHEGFAELRGNVGLPAPGQGTRTGDLLGFSLPLLRHIHEQRRLARAMLARPGNRSGPSQMLEALVENIVRAEIEHLWGDRPEPPASLEAVVQAVAGACVALGDWWVQQDFLVPAEAVDALFQDLVTPGLCALLRTADARAHGATSRGSAAGGTSATGRGSADSGGSETRGGSATG